MTKEEEKVRKWAWAEQPDQRKAFLRDILAMRRAVIKEERERCAKVADRHCIEWEHLEPLPMERTWHRCTTAAAIREGKLCQNVRFAVYRARIIYFLT